MKNISNRTLNLTKLAIFSALIILLTFTPLGYIPLGVVSATTIHIPVIIGAIVLGIKYGSILGGVMGLFSLIRAAVMPNSPIDALFLNPIISVLPRILIGLITAIVFKWLKNLLSDKKFAVAISSGVAAAIGTLVNTITVLGLLALLYGDKFELTTTASAISFIFGSIFAVNGLIEILSAVVLSIPLSIALLKFEKTAVAV